MGQQTPLLLKKEGVIKLQPDWFLTKTHHKSVKPYWDWPYRVIYSIPRWTLNPRDGIYAISTQNAPFKDGVLP